MLLPLTAENPCLLTALRRVTIYLAGISQIILQEPAVLRIALHGIKRAQSVNVAYAAFILVFSKPSMMVPVNQQHGTSPS